MFDILHIPKGIPYIVKARISVVLF